MESQDVREIKEELRRVSRQLDRLFDQLIEKADGELDPATELEIKLFSRDEDRYGRKKALEMHPKMQRHFPKPRGGKQ